MLKATTPHPHVPNGEASVPSGQGYRFGRAVAFGMAALLAGSLLPALSLDPDDRSWLVAILFFIMPVSAANLLMVLGVTAVVSKAVGLTGPVSHAVAALLIGVTGVTLLAAMGLLGTEATASGRVRELAGQSLIVVPLFFATLVGGAMLGRR